MVKIGLFIMFAGIGIGAMAFGCSFLDKIRNK